ncbi:MAG: Gfo/Idh/MocA family oxidoreductase [Bacteroidaceae bacterium]|nr:Gfo/Idh/MocA family oxidoreductase [Bacteroidaceae bacterium]
MIQELITRYKQMRTSTYLHQTYQYLYAFVGMGQHSLTNLYPVLHYLGVPLKYICVTSEKKAQLIERKFAGVKATTSLDDILNDEAIKGVFVSASPSAHFSIASRVLQSGKSLFIEKPPCQTLAELDVLINLQHLYASPVVMVGLQKHYAPSIQLLRKRLRHERLISYDLHYLTGSYPEGNALLDLYIHPLDLVCHLFGKPKMITSRQVAKNSFILFLQHPYITGTIELSTAYSWNTAEETLKVCTHSGIYHLSQMDKLIYAPHPSTFLGIPIEKLHSKNTTLEYLHQCNHFMPTLANNPIYSQGYFTEIQTFVEAVEGRSNQNSSNLQNVRDTYEIFLP